MSKSVTWDLKKQSFLRRILPVSLFIFLFPMPLLAEAKIGNTSPLLVDTSISHEKFDLTQEKGKVVILSFWATWCVPCREEMPIFEEFYRKYHAKGLEIFAVSLDKKRKRDDVVTLMKDYSFPAALADDALINEFGRPSELPLAYLIDKQGIVRAIFTSETNELTEKNLEAALKPLLN